MTRPSSTPGRPGNGPVLDLAQALARVESLAPAPLVLGRALSLLRDPESSLNDIGELIRNDTALAAEVMRCANSSFYGPGGITSIERAVQRIGFRETLHLLTLAVGRMTTHRVLDSYGMKADDFWAESVVNGLFAEGLAHLTRAFTPDEAYTAGLLRYVGRLAIDQSLAEAASDRVWDRRRPVGEWERDTVGFTQSEAGASLLATWKFPGTLVTAIATQEAPFGSGGASALAAALAFASRLLPPGSGLDAVDGLEKSPPEITATDPFVASHNLDPQAVKTRLLDARGAFLAIREALYR